MANLPESPEWEDGIYQLETSDPVLAGPDGIDNLQSKQLANRTQWLRVHIQELEDRSASTEEAETGENNTKWMTPFTVFKAIRSALANATETLRGVLRISTQAEVDTGTDDTAAVTPKKLRWGFVFIRTTRGGAIAFPTWLTGFIIQFGFSGFSNTEGVATVTLPVAFTTDSFTALAGDGTAASTSPLTNICTVGLINNETTRTTLTLRGVRYNGEGANNEGFIYIAIGW